MTDVADLEGRSRGWWTGFALLVATAVGWAINFTIFKFLLREWPPLFSRGIAGVAASVGLAVFALSRGDRLAIPKNSIPRTLLASFTNIFAWMGFSSLALKWLGVGEALLLVYTTPIWSMLFAWPILGVRPSLKGVLSALIGLAGLVVLLSGTRLGPNAGQLWGVALALGAAIFFALGAVANRDPLPMPFVVSTAWQVGLASIPMIVIGVAFEHPHYAALSVMGLWILAYMAVVSMGLCYLAWFATLERLQPTTASTGLLLTPLFGVILAAIILGEPFGLRQLLALGLTFSGVVLALQGSVPGKSPARSPRDEPAAGGHSL